MKNKDRIKGICIIIAILVCLGTLFFLLKDTLIAFLKDPDAVREWVDREGLLSYLYFFLIIVLQVSTIIIPGGVTQIAAGYAFGPLKGILICALGSVGGSMINLLIGSRFGKKLVRLFISEEQMKKLDFSENKKKKFILFGLYVLPGAPKDVLSYFAGIASVEWWKWMLISFFGRIPSVILSTYSGDALQNRDYKAAIIALALMILIAVVGKYIYNKMIRNKEQ